MKSITRAFSAVCLLALSLLCLAQPIVITTNTTIDSSNAATYANKDITIRGCTVTLNGDHRWNSLIIERNGSNIAGVLTHSPEFVDGATKGFTLEVETSVLVEGQNGSLVASRIDLNGKGYNSGTGPGAGTSTVNAEAGGGGHGGPGSPGSNGAPGGIANDSVLLPIDFGSAGGNASGTPNTGGDGGGCMTLVVGGSLTVDGHIRSNGLNGTIPLYRAGGGSGGTIYIEADSIDGIGTIEANGGDGAIAGGARGGGGGGGRVVLFATSGAFPTSSITANGGGGNGYAGAGTVSTRFGVETLPSTLVKSHQPTAVETPLAGLVLNRLDLGANAMVSLSDSNLLSELNLASTSILTHASEDDGFDVVVSGDVTVELNGSIRVDGRGHRGGAGPGAGQSTGNAEGGGAAYGGSGAWSSSASVLGGVVYGNILEPTDLGSGGGNASNTANTGGAGGGSLKFTIGGTCNVDGSIEADGNNGSVPLYRAGGGSGGSIWIDCSVLSGTGFISANGGEGAIAGSARAGGGGGGRIALYYTSRTLDLSNVTALGGGGNARGGGGSILTWQEDHDLPSIYWKNATASPVETPITGVSECRFLHIGNHANMIQGSIEECDTLLVSGNGILTHVLAGPGINLTVNLDATVEAGGTISANGRGYVGGSGPGAGTSTGNSEAGGAGHGGDGGRSSSGALGGAANGLLKTPSEYGSGGGNASNTSGTGGTGGGIIRLIVIGTLTVDGSISVTGNNGTVPLYRAGGGAGGSIWITCASLEGSGILTAAGGNGAQVGGGFAGGGSGGRIAIYSNSTTFPVSQISVTGGTGNVPGGPGTIYTQQGTSNGNIYVAGNHANPAQTPLTDLSGVNLLDLMALCTVRLVGSNSVGNLHVATGCTLTHQAQDANANISVSEDATIDAGGKFDVNNLGFVGGTGPGAGQSTGNAEAGGGGYGGKGGNSSSNALGGAPYGDLVSPIHLGSGGGNASNTPLSGGSGGGVVRMVVTGTLTVNGAISSNGRNGTVPLYRAGGGSGGSIWLTIGNLLGTGSITANGGNGAVSGGARAGGGGGGRISIQGATADFGGTITASGGTGNEAGCAGTIYLSGTVPTISGVITLADIDGPLPDSVAILIRQVGEVCGGWIQYVPLAPDGSYLCYAPGLGPYEMLVKSSTWLQVLTNVNTTGGNVTNFNVHLPFNGDCDEDNEVTLADFAYVSSAFGSIEGDANWNAAADVNRDGEVNLADFGIVAGNFGRAGDQ